MITAEAQYVKDVVQPMILAAHEASLIDSKTLHYMIAALEKRESLWEQLEFYRFFQQEKSDYHEKTIWRFYPQNH